ncbi:hypothetical protein HWV62_1310 [Athelia sp. TMB]|nr:hypothetical protein HWV62_1310 [Athelia sp. TMB]
MGWVTDLRQTERTLNSSSSSIYATSEEIPHSLRRGPPTPIEDSSIKEEDRPVPIESPPLPTLPEASPPRVSREDPQREGGGEPSTSREDNKVSTISYER